VFYCYNTKTNGTNTQERAQDQKGKGLEQQQLY
jgi:hypothetical protein